MRYLLLTLLLILATSAQADELGFSGIATTSSVTLIGTTFGGTDTANASGTLDSLRMYCAVTTATIDSVKAAVYLRNGGVFVDSTVLLFDVATGTGWLTLQFVNNAQIYKDSVYAIIGWATDATGDIRIKFNNSGSNPWAVKGGSSWQIWTDPFNGLTFANTWDASIFAWFTPDAVETGLLNFLHSPSGVGILHGTSGSSVIHEP